MLILRKGFVFLLKLANFEKFKRPQIFEEKKFFQSP